MLAALILWPFARPRLRGRSRQDLGAAVALGACSGVLALAFFEAIARIPLGVAVTIEFLGPLGVALAGSRHARDVAWVLLAGAGVALLTLGDGAGEPLNAAGVAFAAVAAVCWAGYILLTKRVGARWAGLEGLSVSLAVAALVTLPAGVVGRGRESCSCPRCCWPALGLALLMPLAPFIFELIALRRLPTALFGVIMSLEPAIAALLGFADPRPGTRASRASSRSRWCPSRAPERRSARRMSTPDEPHTSSITRTESDRLQRLRRAARRA